MKQFATFLLAACICFSSCKKEDGANQDLDPNDQKKYDLMTNKTGSWWLYGASDSTVSKRLATGKDSVKKGLSFSYYERIDTTSAMKQPTPEYFGKNKDMYLTLIDVDGSEQDYVTVVFFKDSATVGQKWSNTDEYSYSLAKLDMKVESEVKEAGGTMTINGHTYNNVYKVHNKMQGRIHVPPPATADYTDLGSFNVWFVKGIGIIKQELNITIAVGNFTKTYRDSLLDYHIVE